MGNGSGLGIIGFLSNPIGLMGFGFYPNPTRKRTAAAAVAAAVFLRGPASSAGRRRRRRLPAAVPAAGGGPTPAKREGERERVREREGGKL